MPSNDLTFDNIPDITATVIENPDSLDSLIEAGSNFMINLLSFSGLALINAIVQFGSAYENSPTPRFTMFQPGLDYDVESIEPLNDPTYRYE